MNENNKFDINNLSEEAKEYARVIIECIDDGIFITDGDARVIEVNEPGLGAQQRENIIGKTMTELIEEGVYADSAAIQVIKEKKTLHLFQHEETDLLTTAKPYIVNGKVEMVVCCERELDELEIIKKQLNDVREQNIEYERELQQMRSQATKDVNIVAETAEMRKVVDLALTAANFDSRVLIEGETGVGKEVIAKLIYRNGKRQGKPFISVNCGALSETLLESELFGYEKGSFTGASNEGKKGFFEIADKGVLFLDEIGEVSKNFQVKLLRALQENEIIRVGGNKPIPIDTQIIVATNKDLKKKAEEGEFRSDLYYRLNVFPIKIPPLRERLKDIVPLIYLFTKQFNDKYNTEKQFSLSALNVLQRYDWPGNVRELENVIERTILTSVGDIITEDDILPFVIVGDSGNILDSLTSGTWEESMNVVEKEILSRYIKKYKTVAELEKVLQISRSTLNRKLKRYDLRNELD